MNDLFQMRPEFWINLLYIWLKLVLFDHLFFKFYQLFFKCFKISLDFLVIFEFSNLFWLEIKEYIERRHGEPFKFLFLPKMGLLGSQASTWKKVQFWIMSNFWARFFQFFMGKNKNIFIYFLHCSFCTKKLLNKKVKILLNKFGKNFFGVKNCFFRAVLVYFWF